MASTIDNDPLQYTAEPLLDIEVRSSPTRVTQKFALNYDVDGFTHWLSGTDFCTLNTSPLNGTCASEPEPDIQGELNIHYRFRETAWSLDMEWNYMFDVTQKEWELGQEWALDIYTQSLHQWELGTTYAIYGKAIAASLLELINTERSLLGLIPYTMYNGLGEDVATTHSQNMADTGIYAHDDGGFPAGYQTVSQRIGHITEGPTLGAENLAVFADTTRHLETAQELFDIWWNSPPHQANMLYNWGAGDNPQMILGYSMLYDWSGIPGDWWSTFYTQLFIGYGIPLGANLTQWELNLSYQLDTALITELHQGYALDAYTPVTDQLEAAYGINVSRQLEAPYGCGVAAQHMAPIHYTLAAQHEAQYTGTDYLQAQHVAGYAMDDGVVRAFTTGYGIQVAVGHVSPYSLNVKVAAQYESPYEPTIEVTTQHEGGYSILSHNTVTAAHIGYYAMADAAVTVTNTFANIVINGVIVAIEEAVLSLAEGDYAWNASIILTDLSQYQNIVRGDAVVLNILGETYDLVVESKGLTRSGPANVSMRLEALSPSIKHRLPYATLADYENATSVTSQLAVETILGEAVDWQCLDWAIPAKRISSENSVPIDMAQQITASIGAVIEPKKDGSLLARDTFVVNLPNVATATPDQVYTDIEHNLSVTEEYALRDEYNKFHVLEGDAGISDSLEWVPNDDISTGGILRAYPTPWRTTIQIIHTDGIVVSLVPLGIRTRQETNLVEFTEGAGGLPDPAITIDSIVWHSTPLTGLVLEPHSSTITADTTVNQGYGVAEITYTVESIDYESNAPLGSIVQYLIEDL